MQITRSCLPNENKVGPKLKICLTLFPIQNPPSPKQDLCYFKTELAKKVERERIYFIFQYGKVELERWKRDRVYHCNVQFMVKVKTKQNVPQKRICYIDLGSSQQLRSHF